MDTPSVSVRLNPFKGACGPDGREVPWSPYGRILDKRPNFTLDPLFHAGCYYVQDSSAMFVGHLLRKMLRCHMPGATGIRLLDLCAAPGGKTTDAAASLREFCGGDFSIVSNEVMAQRAGVLRDNVALWGDPNVAVTSVDPGAFASLEGYFDIVIADVPCSGEGMFRKDPVAVKNWSPETVKLCAARQKRILADAWPSLREGGILIYSTCTYETEENDDNLLWAARQFGGEVVPVEDEFPGSGVVTTPVGSLLKAGVVPGEGQWAGALLKTSPQRVRRNADISVLRPQWPSPSRAEAVKSDRPLPDFALSMDFDSSLYPAVEVDEATALRFLHRDAFVLPDAAPGYNVVTYLGHPLGFVKNIGKRCNNLLPKSRRILMDI